MAAVRHGVASHPFFRGLRRPALIAHRGGAGLLPENSLAAFRAAVELHRADVLELDVQATRDGALVVSHDATVDRCTGASGALADLTLAQVQALDLGGGARIPTFRQVLEAFPGVKLNVDVKGRDGLEPLLATWQPALEARVCLGSEDDALAAELAARLPGACLFFPREALTRALFSVLAAEDEDAPGDFDERYAVLDMPLDFEGARVFNHRVARAAHAAGRWVNVWTVDREEDMRFSLEAGVDGVMTDRPDRLRRVLDELRGDGG